MADTIRQFRRKVSLLKRQGLLTGTTKSGGTIDARSAQPKTRLSNGRTLQSLVTKYDAIASGKETAVKLSPTKLKAFKKSGGRVVKGRAIIPHTATERVVVERGEVVIKGRNGMERVIIPIPFQNLDKYLRDIVRDHKRINKLKHSNEYFGLRFFGNQSANFYSDIRLLIESLQTYETVTNANTKIKQKQIYQNLEILRMSTRSAREFEQTYVKRRKDVKRAKSKRSKSQNQPEFKRKLQADKLAARMREYRKRLKKQPKKLKKYKKDALKRAAKSRKKK